MQALILRTWRQIMNQIGDIIALKRQNKQMTQDEFASRLGVTPQAVSKWERGQGFPDVTLLEGICTILSIDANLLLGLEAPKNVVENNDLSKQLEIQMNMIAEPLFIEFGSGLIQAFVDGIKTNFVNEQRKKLVVETGMLLPVLRIRDNTALQEFEYQIKSYDKVLKRDVANLAQSNIYEDLILQVTHECKSNYSNIINKQLIKAMMDNLKALYPGEIDGVIPEKIDYLVVLDIMKEVIKRNKTIRNQIKIMEIVEKEYLLENNRNVADIVDKIVDIL
jgi:transcriptional regulator with XRE-family HTH domain